MSCSSANPVRRQSSDTRGAAMGSGVRSSAGACSEDSVGTKAIVYPPYCDENGHHRANHEHDDGDPRGGTEKEGANGDGHRKENGYSTYHETLAAEHQL